LSNKGLSSCPKVSAMIFKGFGGKWGWKVIFLYPYIWRRIKKSKKVNKKEGGEKDGKRKRADIDTIFSWLI